MATATVTGRVWTARGRRTEEQVPAPRQEWEGAVRPRSRDPRPRSKPPPREAPLQAEGATPTRSSLGRAKSAPRSDLRQRGNFADSRERGASCGPGYGGNERGKGNAYGGKNGGYSGKGRTYQPAVMGKSYGTDGMFGSSDAGKSGRHSNGRFGNGQPEHAGKGSLASAQGDRSSREDFPQSIRPRWQRPGWGQKTTARNNVQARGDPKNNVQAIAAREDKCKQSIKTVEDQIVGVTEILKDLLEQEGALPESEALLEETRRLRAEHDEASRSISELSSLKAEKLEEIQRFALTPGGGASLESKIADMEGRMDSELLSTDEEKQLILEVAELKRMKLRLNKSTADSDREAELRIELEGIIEDTKVQRQLKQLLARQYKDVLVQRHSLSGLQQQSKSMRDKHEEKVAELTRLKEELHDIEEERIVAEGLEQERQERIAQQKEAEKIEREAARHKSEQRRKANADAAKAAKDATKEAAKPEKEVQETKWRAERHAATAKAPKKWVVKVAASVDATACDATVVEQHASETPVPQQLQTIDTTVLESRDTGTADVQSPRVSPRQGSESCDSDDMPPLSERVDRKLQPLEEGLHHSSVAQALEGSSDDDDMPPLAGTTDTKTDDVSSGGDARGASAILKDLDDDSVEDEDAPELEQALTQPVGQLDKAIVHGDHVDGSGEVNPSDQKRMSMPVTIDMATIVNASEAKEEEVLPITYRLPSPRPNADGESVSPRTS